MLFGGSDVLLLFFQNQCFKKNQSVKQSGYRLGPTLCRAGEDQIVCNGYQQMTLADKELK